MIAVIQRVTHASVTVDAQCIANIAHGLLVLVGVASGDTRADVRFMVEKIPALRIFSDSTGHMNLSLQDIQWGTAFGVSIHLTRKSCKRAASEFRRPLLHQKRHELSVPYSLVKEFLGLGLSVQTGRFGASMSVSLENDGPVTFILDSRAQEKAKILKRLDPVGR